jgi:hypothetical protein
MALAGGIGVVAVACMAVIYFIVREVMALWF